MKRLILIITRFVVSQLQWILLYRYLKTHPILKLHIGSAKNCLPGWLNTDLQLKYFLFGSLYMDATRPFPFKSNVFDYVFSEHCIEHLNYREGDKMLKEIFRVLKRGGTARLSTPDLTVLLKLYKTKQPTLIQKKYMNFLAEKYFPNEKGSEEISIFVINNAFYNWGHQFLYDKSLLKRKLMDIGFTNISFHKPSRSSNSNLMHLEGHGKLVGTDINNFETFVVEAVKPFK